MFPMHRTDVLYALQFENDFPLYDDICSESLVKLHVSKANGNPNLLGYGKSLRLKLMT